MGGSKVEPDSESPVYGTVHRFKPENPVSTKLDLVRSILAREEGQAVNQESKNAFDRIRQKLLNTRNRVRSSKERSFRRRNSKKRRRNVSLCFALLDWENVVYYKIGNDSESERF